VQLHAPRCGQGALATTCTLSPLFLTTSISSLLYFRFRRPSALANSLLLIQSPTFFDTHYPIPSETMAEIRRKLVIVGDGACGKTCLLMYALAATPVPACIPLPRCTHANDLVIASFPRAPSPRSVRAALLACIPELRQPSWSASASQQSPHAQPHTVMHMLIPSRTGLRPHRFRELRRRRRGRW
jgi:hypothetical protein